MIHIRIILELILLLVEMYFSDDQCRIKKKHNIKVCFSFKVLIIMLAYRDSLNFTVLEQIWHKH